MSTVGGISGTPQTAMLDQLQEEMTARILNQFPEAEQATYKELLSSFLSEKPTLVSPLLASGLSLDVLVDAVGAEARKTTVKTSNEALQAKSDHRKAENDKALGEIKSQLETLAKQNALSPFQKFFKYLGMALGAIASIATIAIGAMTGNPLMVAAGVMMAVMVVDSIVSDATDGKVSISAGVAKAAEACGASEETAKWIGLGVTVGLTLASIAMSLGSSAAGSASTLASNVANALAKFQQASTVVSGITAVGNGACQIAQAVFQNEVTHSKARVKDIDAILERIRESMETEADFLKFVMEKFQGLLTTVSDIVKDSHEAQVAIQTSQAPLA